MFTVGTRNGNLQRYGPRPTTCWPTICWPTTCWPTTCWPTTCWPTSCWPTTGWPTSCWSTTCGWTHHLLTHYLLTRHRLTHYLLTYHLRTQCKKIPTNLWTTDPSPANLLAKCRRDPLPSGLLTHQFACLHTGLQQESNATQHRLYGWHLTCWPAVLNVQKQTSWTAPLHGHLESQSNTLSTFCIFILNWPAPAPAVSRVTCMGSPDGLVQLTAQLTHCIRHA